MMAKSINKAILPNITIIVIAGSLSPLNAQLPDESLLPGERLEPPVSVQLPDESELPTDDFLFENDSPEIPIDSDPPPVLVILPGEEQLPGEGDDSTTQVPDDPTPPDPLPQDVAPQDAAAQQLRALRLDQSPDERPWLRVNSNAPTSHVLSLSFSGDSNRLVAAGLDKSVFVWQQLPGVGNQPENWNFQRSLRWPIQRGKRGIITLTATRGNLLAAAGEAAYGANGDIFLFDLNTGNLNDVLFDDKIGHREVLRALVVSPSKKETALVSADKQGKIVYWQIDRDSGLWKAKVIRKTDEEVFGKAAQKLEPWREYAPVAMLDGKRIVYPDVAGFKREIPVWKLMVVHIDRPEEAEPLMQRTNNYPYHGIMVTALTVSPDGKRFASSDFANQRFLWTIQPKISVRKIAGKSTGVTMAFHPNRPELMLGSINETRSGSKSTVEIIDVKNAKITAAASVAEDVKSCAFNPDGSRFVYSQGNRIKLIDANRGFKPIRELQSGQKFANQIWVSPDRPYRIAFKRDEIHTDVFDAEAASLTHPARMNLRNWRTHETSQRNWSVRIEGASYFLYNQETKAARIPIDFAIQGVIRSTCWLAEANDKPPFAVIVGLQGSNHIHVFRIANQGVCQQIREFRGHAAEVTDLVTTHDGRYLISTSNDATTRIWPLSGIATDSRQVNRWGATFGIRDGRLVVTDARKDGAVYFRGIRSGDTIRRIGYLASGNKVEWTSNTREMVQRLSGARLNDLLAFQYSRGAAAPKRFLLRPAWQQVASLYIGEANEWAFWSPSGYYNSSFEGHKMFGWQVNRGRNELPDFFLAAQFREALERPKVISKLLQAGNIDDAFVLADAEAPARPDQAILDQYKIKPVVSILPIDETNLNKASSIPLEAEIRVPAGESLVATKAFANGVVATEREILSEESDNRGTTYRYRWKANLPSDQRIKVQVVAATDSQVIGMQDAIVQRSTMPQQRKPRLFAVSVGINEYRDSQIQPLDFAVNNATRVSDAIQRLSSSYYQVDQDDLTVLTDDNAVRPLWQVSVDSYVERLKTEVIADDLLVIFLSGHGLQDEQTGEFFYVGADARFEDLMQRQFADCLSFSDFSSFSKLACRKLVVLDTCHSGAITSDLGEDLKAALRILQDDMMFTLTSSSGTEESVELREKELGRFTYRLLEALEGKADRTTGNKNGTNSFREVVDYVTKWIDDDSANDVYLQTPTAGPKELLEIADFPLSSSQPISNR